MDERSRRQARAPSREQLEERFDTGGMSFEESLQRVLAGGPDEHTSAVTDDDGKADE